MAHILQSGAIALGLFGFGAASVSYMQEDMPDLAIPAGDWEDVGALDGRVFYTTDTVIETGDVLEDELHFKDGTFQSAMCQVYCDFGWSEYKTWADGDVLRFAATTQCPDAPHTVVFYGMIDGDNVTFDATWTTRRWYWTRQINATGQGSTTPPPEATG
ncbi:MAG: hypothetical protein AAFN59_09845 [Pseudomonadota bacterium]